jgi:hypothetical protein
MDRNRERLCAARQGRALAGYSTDSTKGGLPNDNIRGTGGGGTRARV